MDLHSIKTQPSDFIGCLHHLIMRFAWDAQDHMSTTLEAPSSGTVDRVDLILMSVRPIHPRQSRRVHRLHAKLNRDVVIKRDGFQEIQNGIRDTIRTRPHRKSNDFGAGL